MTTFNSKEKEIRASRKKVYDFITDVNNLNALVPEGKVSNFRADRDSCQFNVDGLGQVGIRVVSREPENNILFESEGSVPFNFDVLINLHETGPGTTIMKIILNANLNMIMKAVANKPLKEGVEVIASELADHLNGRVWDNT
jgi:carbon monoxide dehydrogenase subunit G